MGVQLDGETALLVIGAVVAINALFVFAARYIRFGQSQLDRELKPLCKQLNGHEDRLRTVEGDLREIRTLQREMRDDIKDIKGAI
jgi:hypothetical protein